MKIEQYISRSEDVSAIAEIGKNEQTRGLEAALSARLAELRAKVELSPIRSDDLSEDVSGVLGEIRGLCWVLRLRDECRARLSELSSPGELEDWGDE